MSPAQQAEWEEQVMDYIRRTGATAPMVVAKFVPLWHVSRNTVLAVKREVYRKMRQDADEECGFARERQREALARQLEVADSMGDVRNALKALDQLAKVEGAYKPDHLTLTGDIAIGPANPEATRARMAELLADPEVQALMRATQEEDPDAPDEPPSASPGKNPGD